ncbi:EF-hand calcium-binding domain-containing protein 6 [Clonorchis sinensis]|uniref:EF-hand calcium-binding domain-containing protein 6 n=1 Tax=Clonorchis sinensis TaxID=79923 RepID=G7YFU6_CLOSI|nr:EF-hand calcium-binding domain-containing protein 6 [Clonorchis sinensis]
MLQEIACDPSFDLKRLLPSSCFEPNGRVLCPQLRQAMKLMRINLIDENFRRLWRDKLDLERLGSIKTSHLCQILNLKEDGTPLGIQVKVTPLEAAKICGIPKLNRNPRLLSQPEWPRFEMLLPHSKGKKEGVVTLIRELPVAGGTGFPLPEQHTWSPQGPGGATEPVFGCGDRYQKRLEKLEKHYPRFDNIMDCLHYKFENPYQAMMVSFKRFDPKHNNRVRENECLGILREYGLNINAEDLHTFVRRILSPSEATGCSLGRDQPPETIGEEKAYTRIRPGFIPYKRLLAYYQNRAKGSPAHQRLQALKIRGAIDGAVNKKMMLNPDEVEEELVKLLHKNYMEFVKLIDDGSGPDGKIDEQTLREIVNQIVGFVTSEEQWEEFKRHLPYTDTGRIKWGRFLAKFNHPKNIASEKTTALFDYKKNQCPPSTDHYHGDVRDKATLLRMVEHTVRTRLHHIDMIYKQYDRKEENMISKEEFGELLAGQGLDIIPEELDYLWSLLQQIEPGREIHNYRQVMNFFFNRTRPTVAEFGRLKRYGTITDANLQQLVAWRKDLKQLREVNEAHVLKGARIATTLGPRDPLPVKPTTERLISLCNKISPVVSTSWDALQHALIESDPSGSEKISWDNFKNIARRFNFPLSERELTELCRGFDSKEKDFINYHRFMKHFSENLPEEKPVPTLFDERLYHFTNLNNGEKLTFVHVLGEIRKACLDQSRTLLEAFRKLDTKRQGILTVQKIEQLLQKRNIKLSEDDLYHLQSSFDSHMRGCITFEDFKRTALKAFKPV